MSVTSSVRGEREVALRFDTFPEKARENLKQAIDRITGRLQEASRAAAPYGSSRYRKGPHLRDEIARKVFTDTPNRIAGYVEVYAPDDPLQYPKAATLEYGTNKPRRIFAKRNTMLSLVGSRRRRALLGITKAVHIEPFRYLRGPVEAQQAQIRAELEQAVADAARDES